MKPSVALKFVEIEILFWEANTKLVFKRKAKIDFDL